MSAWTREVIAVNNNRCKKVKTFSENENKTKPKNPKTSPASLQSKDTRQQFKHTSKQRCLSGLEAEKMAQLYHHIDEIV